MKEEKEFVLLMQLIESPFDGGGIITKRKSASKGDLERYFGITNKNREFRVWIQHLIEEGCMKASGLERRGFGKPVEVYVVDKKETFKRLKENASYRIAIEFFGDRAFMGAIAEG